MKKLILILMILFCANWVSATSNVTIAWDANSESDLAGYKMYQTFVSGDYENYDQVWDIPLSALQDITNPEYTIENIQDGQFYWSLTAYDNSGNESGFSNEVNKLLDTIAPNNPINLKIKIIVKIEIQQ